MTLSQIYNKILDRWFLSNYLSCNQPCDHESVGVHLQVSNFNFLYLNWYLSNWIPRPFPWQLHTNHMPPS